MQHPQVFSDFLSTKATTKQLPKRSCVTTSSDGNDAKKLCQKDISKVLTGSLGNRKVSQVMFQSALQSMLLEDMMPMATVERTGFKKFCSTVLPDVMIPSRRTMMRNMNELYKTEKKKLISQLQEVKYVSCTADLWSSHNRGFLGMTVHYVDVLTLDRVSHTLVCRRFEHTHTGQRIAQKIAEVLKEFGITDKVVNFVTDNAANMVKAFSLLPGMCHEMEDSEGRAIEDDTGTDTDGFVENDVEVLSVTELAETTTRDQVQQAQDEIHSDYEDDDDNSNIDTGESAVKLLLLEHKRCANHTLNLVASVDSLKARENVRYKRIYDGAMAKVQGLSNAVHRSTKNADIVADEIGLMFLNPTCTRWSSSYAAVQRIVQVGLEKTQACQQRIGLHPLSEDDMTFLTAYVTVMRPIAIAMEMFQGEKDCFIGHVIPTIKGIENKLSKMTDKLTAPLVNALKAGLNMRFSDILDSDDYKVATMLLPKFKLNYLESSQRPAGKALLIQAVQQVVHAAASATSATPAATEPVQAPASTTIQSSTDDDDLYGFMMEQNIESVVDTEVNAEVELYIASASVETKSLLAFPKIAAAFCRYNAALPSSAVVERLFSVAGQILTARRCKMSDENFDHSVFLRYIFKE